MAFSAFGALTASFFGFGGPSIAGFFNPSPAFSPQSPLSGGWFRPGARLADWWRIGPVVVGNRSGILERV